MNARVVNHRGFTLIELLTVIAIIALLIGILVPSLSAARDQAKKAATRAQLQAIETGCQTFQNDNGAFPRSNGYNPFEASGNAVLTGAQWIALQLVGADAGGYVKPVIANDSGGSAADGVIDYKDWEKWYSLTPDREYGRVGPYVTVDGKILRSPEEFAAQNPDAGALPEEMLEGSSDEWPNRLAPFFVDAFNAPILYYRANEKVKAPFTTGTPGSNFEVGKFDHSDNAVITGQDEANGAMAADISGADKGWDVAGRGDLPNGLHPLGVFGYDRAAPNRWPEPGTFAATLSDRAVWESTRRGDEGKIQPYKGDRFILISAGKDGLYGTTDDVRNFEASDN